MKSVSVLVGLLLCVMMAHGAYAETAFVMEDSSRYVLRQEGYLERVDGDTFSKAQTRYAIRQRYVIDDFNVKRALSRSHATIAAWTLNPSDDTQQCRFSYETHDVRANRYGQSIKVRYDVENWGEAVNGFFLKIMNIDITLFDYVSFWLQGDDYYSYTDKMKIGFKNETGDKVEYSVYGISGEWKNYVIDIAEMRDELRWQTISEVYTIFESNFVTRKKGVLYIDQIEYLSVVK